MDLRTSGQILCRVGLSCTIAYALFSVPVLAQQSQSSRASQVQKDSVSSHSSPDDTKPEAKTLGVLPVLGKGTTNAIPIWTGTYSIGNSILSQSGGTLTVSGTVGARSFVGDGSALTNVNANLLSGLTSSAFAQQGTSNTFTGDQTITGNLNVSGYFNNALSLQGNLTDADGQQGANVLGGFTGFPGFPGNSIAPGVIGATIAGGGGAYFPAARAAGKEPALKYLNRAELAPLLVRGASATDRAEQGRTNVNPTGLTSGGNVVQALSNWSTIAGGLGNTTSGTFSTVAGGENNSALGTETTVGGGSFNKAASTSNTGGASTVAGGDSNTASADFSSVGGGQSNLASGNTAAVVGGYSNVATGDYSLAGGGALNQAEGEFSVALGGLFNEAQADYSTAGGCGSWAYFTGSFVWNAATLAGDGGCTSHSLRDTGPGQFVIRAPGGFIFYSSAGSGATLPSGSGSWSSMSDRNSKANFTGVDTSALLEKIAALPLSTWSYKTQADSIRHLGPMAQDFRAAFGLGEDDKHISNIDSEGVSLAGIQALYKLNQEKDKKIAELSNALENLAERLAAIEQVQH
jgi:trimeric autotransporter adhesin